MARILVVDDEPEIGEILEMLLTHVGHEVRVATNGDSALQLARAAPVDLIITDIFMPGKEGIETIMEIRRDLPSVKIIALSGGGHTGELNYLRDAVQLGAVRTLLKPFGNAEILEAVRAALGASSPHPGEEVQAPSVSGAGTLVRAPPSQAHRTGAGSSRTRPTAPPPRARVAPCSSAGARAPSRSSARPRRGRPRRGAGGSGGGGGRRRLRLRAPSWHASPPRGRGRCR